MTDNAPESEPITLPHRICLRCECVCDDLQIRLDGGRVTEVEHACDLGRRWFLETATERLTAPDALLTAIDIDEVIGRAASLMNSARRPLLMGLETLTSEAMRVAVGLGDRIGAAIDPAVGSEADIPSATAKLWALQRVGMVTATWGELRNRAETVLLWNCDPVRHQPRFVERFLNPQYLHGGERTVVLLTDHDSETAEIADHVVRIPKGCDLEIAGAFRLWLRGEAWPTGIGFELPGAVQDRLRNTTHGAIVYGSATAPAENSSPAMPHHDLEAVFALTREWNDHARWTVHTLSRNGLPHGMRNRAAATQVLTWQTGFTDGVDLSTGVPRSNREAFSARNLLRRGEADLLVLCDGTGDVAPLDRLPIPREKLPPTILLTAAKRLDHEAQVTLPIRTLGVDDSGTIYRGDGITLPLKPLIESDRPSAADLLTRLRTALTPKPTPQTEANR